MGRHARPVIGKVGDAPGGGGIRSPAGGYARRLAGGSVPARAVFANGGEEVGVRRREPLDERRDVARPPPIGGIHGAVGAGQPLDGRHAGTASRSGSGRPASAAAISEPRSG